MAVCHVTKDEGVILFYALTPLRAVHEFVGVGPNFAHQL